MGCEWVVAWFYTKQKHRFRRQILADLCLSCLSWCSWPTLAPPNLVLDHICYHNGIQSKYCFFYRMNYTLLIGAFCGLLASGCTERPTEPAAAGEPSSSHKALASRDAGPQAAAIGPDDSAATSLPLVECRADFIYEVREPAVAGHANVFVGVSGWDASEEDCWYSLSEYYNNIAPDSGVTLQKAYFIAEPNGKAVNKVSSWAQMTETVKSRVIGVAVYDDKAEAVSFQEAPFHKGPRKQQ